MSLQKEYIDLAAMQIASGIAVKLFERDDIPSPEKIRRASKFAHDFAFSLWDYRESLLSKIKED